MSRLLSSPKGRTPAGTGVRSRPKADPGAFWRNQFAADLVEGPVSLTVGAGWARAYVIAAFPPHAGLGWLATAANLDGVTLAIHARPTDPTEMVTHLSRTISTLAGQLTQGGSALTQQRAEAQLADAQALMRQIDLEQQGVWTTLMMAVVWGATEAEGLRRAKRLEAVLGGAGMRARVLAYRQAAGLLAAGPWVLTPPELQGGLPWTLPTLTLAASFPMSSGGINHGRGLLLGQDSQGGLALVDRWTPPEEAGIVNHNFNILAASGGGKTYTASRLMLREWAQGAQIIAIDPLSDYRALCEAVGGTWIDAGSGGRTRLNPLQAPPAPVGDGEGGDTAEHARPVWAHLQQVHLFFDLYLPDLSSAQRALLGRALRAVYAARGIEPETDPATIPPEGWPHVGDVYAQCQSEAATPGADAGWATLAALLEEAAVGTEADLWAGPSTLPPDALDSGFVVFDVHRLDRAPLAVQQAQYLNILSYAWSLAQRRPDQRTDLVIDEAWMLVNPKVPQALSFLKRMAKSIRHYQGSLVTITQNPGDFLFPEVAREGEPVLSNASIKLLLRQEARDLPTVTQLYGLSDAEQDLLRAAGRGQGLLIAGNHRAWVQIQGAPYEAALLGQG